MYLRKGDETLIKPHIFDKEDFVTLNPFIKEIINTGIKISLILWYFLNLQIVFKITGNLFIQVGPFNPPNIVFLSGINKVIHLLFQ